MAKKAARLYTKAESEFCGWDEELITEYPTEEVFAAYLSVPNRSQMLRWHRFLVEPKTVEEIKMVERLIERLTETCPGAG